jgi:HAD superfamily hydrolase (TIGR01459 family)
MLGGDRPEAPPASSWSAQPLTALARPDNSARMNQPTRPAAPPPISGLSDVAASYDVVLSDIWGVVHNGIGSFPAAADALTRFRAGGGVVVLITNAPRPSAPILRQLAHLKAPPSAWDAIVTSGDVTVNLIRAKRSAPVHHIGPPRDQTLFDLARQGAPDVPAPGPLASAEYVLCTGLFDDERETPADYEDTFATMLARRMPLICANPDLVVHRGEELIYCAGALAQRYEELGGVVVCAGKPFAPIYDEALRLARIARGAPVDKARVLAIGDAIRTDIEGAAAYGLDSLFVTGGIHRDELHGPEESGETLQARFWRNAQPRPVATIRDLMW